jgi:hypothetical protein
MMVVPPVPPLGAVPPSGAPAPPPVALPPVVSSPGFCRRSDVDEHAYIARSRKQANVEARKLRATTGEESNRRVNVATVKRSLPSVHPCLGTGLAFGSLERLQKDRGKQGTMRVRGVLAGRTTENPKLLGSLTKALVAVEADRVKKTLERAVE